MRSIERRAAAARRYVQSSGSPWPPSAANTPPSATSTEPVTYDASSDARKSATFAISSGVPMRCTGICLLEIRAPARERVGEQAEAAACRSTPGRWHSPGFPRRGLDRRRAREVQDGSLRGAVGAEAGDAAEARRPTRC